jgi:hypothetical protein
MFSPTKGRITAAVIAALFTVACGDEGPATDTPPYTPPVTFDSSVAPVVAAEAAVANATPDAGSIARPDAGSTVKPQGLDAGVDSAVAIDPVPTADAGDAGASEAGDSSEGGTGVPGSCCPDGNCLCHGEAPKALTTAKGPYKTTSYALAGAGCVYYPTDGVGKYAAVTVSDGFFGAGGCGPAQTNEWGPLYASWGIVTMIVDTGSLDQPDQRGMALTKGLTALKAENMKSGSPLMGKLSGRYGTSGFSMGGGGTTFAASGDPTLKTNVVIMGWGPTSGAKVTVPSLVICGTSDSTAPCATYGTPFYNQVPAATPKMRISINSGHAGQPSSGGGKSGQFGLAFQKVFLEGDTRWRPLLVGGMTDASNIK